VSGPTLIWLLETAGITSVVQPLQRFLSLRGALALVAAVAAAGTAIALASAHKASAADTAAAPRSVTTGVVVVETQLGYQQSAAAGTGMVLTSSGRVLTNNHVIDGATAIRVRIPGSGRTYRATVVGYAVGADVALLQLAGAHGLATVQTGDSSKVRVGQAVRAVGNAGGTGVLSTAPGTVTGLGRTITAGNEQGESEQLTGLIETNAAVEPGDSGGPLLDRNGKVVGIDTAASAAGHGFFFQDAASDAYAIPINRALALVTQITSGKSSAAVHIGATAFLGVDVSSPGSFGLGGLGDTPAAPGVVVAGVVPGSPADGLGLTTGDEIVAVDGSSIGSPDALRALMLRHHPGDTVTLTWSDSYGNERSGTVTLASGPPQ